MKPIKPMLALLAATSFLSSPVAAQSVTDTITVEGRLDSLTTFTQLGTEEAQLDPEATFVATFEVDRTMPVSYQNNGESRFADALLSSAVELYDGQGEPIQTLIVTRCDDTTFITRDGSQAAFDQDDGSLAYTAVGGDAEGRGLVCEHLMRPLIEELLPAEPSYPIPVPGEYESDFSAAITNGDISRGIQVTMTGTAERITVEVTDTDGDGVADFSDACVSVDSETVVFNGWHDSGVTNHTDAQGCTIMDAYAACNVEEEETSRFTRRSFSYYRGPSYCEKQVAYGLVSDGMIDYGEARALRDALYFAHRNQPET